MLVALVKRDGKRLPLAAVCLVSFIVVGSWKKVSLHYLLFIYPALALLAGDALCLLAKRLGRKRKAVFFIATLAAFQAWQFGATTRFALNETRDDGRWAAFNWMQSAIPQESVIAADDQYVPLMPSGLFFAAENVDYTGIDKRRLQGLRTYRLQKLSYNLDWLRDNDASWLVLSSYCFDRFSHSPPPPSDNPLYDEFIKRRAFYQALIDRPEEYGWTKASEHYTGKGPRIIIYKRIASR